MFELFVSTFTTLFVVIDPIGVLPIFVTLAAPLGQASSRALAGRAVLIATAILIFFAFVGNAFLGLLHVTVDAFRIGGGILLLLIGVQMVFEQRSKRRQERTDQALEDGASISDDGDADWRSLAIFPMAIPLMAGPGAMTSLLLLSAEYGMAQVEFWVVIATLLLIMIIAWVLFFLGSGLARFVTPQVSLITSRILGVILCALAVSFTIDGIKGAFGLG